MIIYKYAGLDGLPEPTGRLKAKIPAQALRILDADGMRAHYYASAGLREIDVAGLTLVESVPLSDLSLEELQAVVNWADVDTSAGTVSGLRRAIERHLEP